MNFPETSYTRTIINGIFSNEEGDLFRFENKEAFRLMDGWYCVISDCLLAEGGVYSEVLKVQFLANSFEEMAGKNLT